MTMVDSLKQVLLRDIRSLERELDGYDSDEQIWELPDGVRNSTGTLVMHLCGNLRHFIGQGIGKSGYERDRNFEFAGRDMPRAMLKKFIDDTQAEVDSALSGIHDAQLMDSYPNAPGGNSMTVGLFLIHLSAHLGYHLGQLDYHRRMVTGKPDGIGAVAVTEIGE